MILKTQAKIIFDPKDVTKKHISQSSWKKVVIAEIPGDLCDYYAWFLKSRFGLVVQTPLRNAHMTIVNDKYDWDRKWNRIKEKWNNTLIDIEYSNNIRSNGEHWWLKLDKPKQAMQLRQDLGLRPEPFFTFHITIGSPNNKMAEHSQYILRQLIRFDM